MTKPNAASFTHQQEIEHVRRKLFDDDVYHANRVFSSDQIWLDVGSHVGLFTTLATSYGCKVVGGIDSDPEAAAAYRAMHDLPCLEVHVNTVKNIMRSADNILLMDSDERANAIKLDIQGSELRILSSPHEVGMLSRHFDTILAEIHEPAQLTEIIDNLNFHGYKLDYAEAATDILTHQDTYIIHTKK